MIGGIEVPYKFGLLAHSDGDVLIHSIIDALLGACGLRDIGTLFPNSDGEYAGTDSKKLLVIVFEKILNEGFKVVNIDSTVIAEEPKLAPYIQKMRETIASILKMPFQNVNVKAKTNEGMGFIGKKEGIASISVVLVEKI
ncbi:MAG: 2-C-methyl-D-erythritol 2,4-cyclodiphosphate synthase [Caldisericum sp. CG2_30_36_11]|jgi:2-C-methyl-D-erythritol 2,4-cyclodiphosphate synthase|nr:MAG: 2-C-methyl-D-erythritol 2,4-cyclodiphosphate synthase [Caldisericum sp. CG2_30_36_11]